MTHDRTVASLLAAALLVLAPGATRAEWQPGGSPLAPRTGAVIAPDSHGGVFASTGYPDRFVSLFRLGPTGGPAVGWPATGLQLTPGMEVREHDTTAPIGMLADGEGGCYVLTAEQFGNTGHGGFVLPVWLYVHRVTAEGLPAVGWTSRGVRVSTLLIDHRYETHHLPSMVSDGKGGVIVTWLQLLIAESYANAPVMVQRVAGSSERLWGDDGIVVHAGRGACTLPAAVADMAGGAYVFWGQWNETSTTARVFGQRMNPAGTPLWAADGRAVSSGAFTALDQGILPDGGWVWQFYTPAIAAVSDGDHGAIIGWSASSGADLDVYANRVTARGGKGSSRDLVLCAAPGQQASVACVHAGQGGALFAWRDGRTGADVSIRAQFVIPAGRVRWTRDGVVVADGPGDRGAFECVADGREGFYFVWADTRLGGQVFVQRLMRNGRRAPGWSRSGTLVSRQAAGDPNVGGQFPHVVRAASGSAVVSWSDPFAGSLAMLLTPRGPAVLPAAAALPLVAASTQTPVPATSFALLGTTPHPVIGSALLRFVLPSPGPALLELFDLAGRRVWSSEMGLLGAGEHVVALADGRHLPAGIYLARLAQGVRMTTRRVVVLQ